MSPDRTASLSHFAFMPLPNFTMIAFTNAIEVLRMANYLSGQTLYRWSIVSPDGGPVTASNGLAVDTGPVESIGQKLRNGLGLASFNIAPVDHVHWLAILE